MYLKNFSRIISFTNWKRSTTIHTHPNGGLLSFSNELEGFDSGGDLQWALRSEIDLYLVPPSGDFMGKFNVKRYMQLARFGLEVSDKTGYFKKMSDNEMFHSTTIGILIIAYGKQGWQWM